MSQDACLKRLAFRTSMMEEKTSDIVVMYLTWDIELELNEANVHFSIVCPKNEIFVFQPSFFF